MTPEPFWSPDDETVRRLLERVRRIAAGGLSPKPHRDSNRVARYLQERGYAVIPVYPRETEILGQTVYRNVRDIPEKVDLVDVFRRSSEVGRAMDDAVAAGGPPPPAHPAPGRPEGGRGARRGGGGGGRGRRPRGRRAPAPPP